jgi:quercetin dioxygenase-like cupin family protein
VKHETEKSATDELVANVTKLTELLRYQKKAVVSRSIMDKETGTITLFAFDEGQGLSEHTASYDALVYILEGETEVTIEGKPIILRGGEMTIMPANKPHAVKALTKFKMLLIMIREQR